MRCISRNEPVVLNESLTNSAGAVLTDHGVREFPELSVLKREQRHIPVTARDHELPAVRRPSGVGQAGVVQVLAHDERRCVVRVVHVHVAGSQDGEDGAVGGPGEC